MPIEDKSLPFTFFLTFRILFASFLLENSTMTYYLVNSGNPLCWKSLFWHPASWTTGELCLPVLNFQLTRGGHLPSGPLTVTPSFQWNNLLPQFWDDLSGDTKFWLYFLIIMHEVRYFFIYVYQGWIKLVLVFQSQSNYFILRWFLQCRFR